MTPTDISAEFALLLDFLLASFFAGATWALFVRGMKRVFE